MRGDPVKRAFDSAILDPFSIVLSYIYVLAYCASSIAKRR